MKSFDSTKFTNIKRESRSGTASNPSRQILPPIAPNMLRNMFFLESRVKSYGTKSVTGKSPSNPNKKNQDAEFSIKNFDRIKNAYFFGVLDGHGINGHLVSDYVKKSFLNNMEADVMRSFQNQTESKVRSSRFKSSNLSFDTINKNLILSDEMIIDAFSRTNNDLQLSSIDISYSGTTLVSVMILGDELLCTNVGDSRAIMGSLKNGSWKAKSI